MVIAPMDVEDVIREAIHGLGPGELDVRLLCPPNLTVMADRERLHRVLTNYLSNAFRHGSPPVVVEAFGSAGWVEIRVSDAGPGVPAEFIGRLFDKFTQADRTTSPAGGTGLGLAIVRELAQAQGGRAWHEAGEITGSTFCIRLPAVADAIDRGLRSGRAISA